MSTAEAVAVVPAYFELSWSVLSTIGAANVLFGCVIVGIVGTASLSHVSAVPIVVSAAGAVANGLCYYAFYTNYSPENRAVASGFADVMWMVRQLSCTAFLCAEREPTC